MRKKINCKKKRKKYEFSIFKFYDISKKFKYLYITFHDLREFWQDFNVE